MVNILVKQAALDVVGSDADVVDVGHILVLASFEGHQAGLGVEEEGQEENYGFHLLNFYRKK